MPVSSTHNGWRYDPSNSRLDFYYRGTRVGHITSTGLVTAAGQAITVTDTGLTVSSGGITVTGNSTITGTLGGLTGLTVASGGATITAGGLTVTAGGVAVTAGGLRLGTGANMLGLGAAQAVTIATGVATVTKPYVKLSGEGAADDQLDTITYTGAAEGDLLILTRAANTITVDDANIDLGAATRVLSATGHYLGLIYDGAGWGELFFIQGDNA